MLPARLVSRKQHADRWRTEIATLEPITGPEPTDFRIVLLMPRRVRWLLWVLHRFVPRQARSHEHCGFQCASLEALEERAAAARAAGAPIENPITALSSGESWLLEVLDPDRNAVEWIVGRAHD